MKIFHSNLAAGRWHKLKLVEQLGNIGSEVNRTLLFKDKDKDAYFNAAERALELFDLTLSDPRWKHRLKEIARTRELFCQAVYVDKKSSDLLKDLNKYFYHFGLASRINR